MKRTDYLFLLLLITVTIVIYFPVFYSNYLYSDEASQLWFYNKNLNFDTSVPQGRYITYKLFKWLFGHVNTVHEVIYARLFSLLGWILCLPIWYYIIKKVIEENALPKVLGLMALLYMICMPPFAVFIGWAACMQMFIACTAGLISGYILYAGVKYDGHIVKLSTITMVLAALFGVVALFTYQNGFCCFLIPFLIHFIAIKKFNKKIYIGIIFSFLIYLIYYCLFKYNLQSNAIEMHSRASFTADPITKIGFLFSRPLTIAFNFTQLYNEENAVGVIRCIIFAAFWLTTYFIHQKKVVQSQKIIYLLGLLCFAVLLYLPSLLVKENYASHRTLFALDLGVFLLFAELLFSIIKKIKIRNIVACSLGVIFLANAWYNYNRQFLQPLKTEYNQLSNFINQRFQPGIDTIYFICPNENYFEKKYGLVRSWDEFGVPSTAKKWVPEPLIKQLIFEKTNNRALAEKIIVQSWENKAAFEKSAATITKSTLLINLSELQVQ